MRYPITWWLSMVSLLILITCYQLKFYKSCAFWMSSSNNWLQLLHTTFRYGFYTLVCNKANFFFFYLKKGIISHFDNRRFIISDISAFKFHLKDKFRITCQSAFEKQKKQIHKIVVRHSDDHFQLLFRSFPFQHGRESTLWFTNFNFTQLHIHSLFMIETKKKCYAQNDAT